MRISDDLMRKYFELATDMAIEDIESALSGHPRQAKIVLGKAIVSRYYDDEMARKAAEEFDRIFKEHKIPDDIPQIKFLSNDNQTHKIWIVKLLVDHGFASTNGEARRLISQGGVSIDNKKYADPAQEVDIKSGMILKVGKRRFAEIVITQSG
jgi:tyrosyl-tRNA synthetase